MVLKNQFLHSLFPMLSRKCDVQMKPDKSNLNTTWFQKDFIYISSTVGPQAVRFSEGQVPESRFRSLNCMNSAFLLSLRSFPKPNRRHTEPSQGFICHGLKAPTEGQVLNPQKTSTSPVPEGRTGGGRDSIFITLECKRFVSADRFYTSSSFRILRGTMLLTQFLFKLYFSLQNQ